MTETVQRRRRWPWMLLAALVLSIGGPVVWRLRPLNAEERAVVGVWTAGRDPVRGIDRHELTLSPYRSFLRRYFNNDGSVSDETGSWHIDGRALVISFHLPTRTYLALCLRHGVLPQTEQARYELQGEPPRLRRNVMWERVSD